MVTKDERAQLYVEFLEEQGFRPQIDEAGDVAFRFEGGYYVITIDPDDDEFFQLLFPSFFTLRGDEDRRRAAPAAVVAAARTKVVKVYAAGDRVHAAAEAFCSPPESVRPVLLRMLGAIQAAVHQFHEAMRVPSVLQ